MAHMAASAHTLKLTYFDIKVRGEPTRLAFHIGGTKFEDERIMLDEFPAIKPTTPFGMLPVLSVDGEMYAESNAMLRCAGKMGGLYPKCEVAALKVDMVVDALETVLTALLDSKCKEGRGKFVKEVIPRYIGAIDRMYSVSKGPYLLGDQMSIADVKLMCTLEGVNEGMQWEHIPAGVLDKYSHVMGARKAIGSHEKVREWNAMHA